MVCASNISFSFNNKVIFDDASLNIKSDSITAIYSPSGSGKSTFAKILTGCYKLNSGTITLDESVIAKPNYYNRKLGLPIQMVYQNPSTSFDPAYKLINSITELIRYHKICEKEEEKALINYYLKLLNLDKSILNHKSFQLSGGEAQRIALVKALILKPKLLILDEATSMLDVSVQANVMALAIKSVKKIKGSILVITHDKELATTISDEIYTIENYKFVRIK